MFVLPDRRSKVLVCPMKSAPVLLLLTEGKHVSLPVDDDSDLNIVAAFDRRGEYIYTGNAKGKVNISKALFLRSIDHQFLCSCPTEARASVG